MLTVMVTATDDNLALREDIKEELDHTDSKDDPFIDRLITRSSRRIESYLTRPIAIQKYQAIIPAYGGVNLRLPAYPIRDVFRVFDGSDTGASLELTATEYRVDKERGFINRDVGFKWTRQVESMPSNSPAEIIVPDGEYKNWLIEFSAGYILSGGLATDSPLWSTVGGSTATGQTLPEDIEDAAIQIVKTKFIRRRDHPSVLVEKIGDVSVRYKAEENSDIPRSIANSLDRYVSH